MCSGLLVIGSSIPEIENEQIINRENGLIFTVGDSRHLAEVLFEAIQDVALSSGIIERAVSQAIRSYNIHRVAEQYQLFYSELLGEEK